MTALINLLYLFRFNGEKNIVVLIAQTEHKHQLIGAVYPNSPYGVIPEDPLNVMPNSLFGFCKKLKLYL